MNHCSFHEKIGVTYARALPRVMNRLRTCLLCEDNPDVGIEVAATLSATAGSLRTAADAAYAEELLRVVHGLATSLADEVIGPRAAEVIQALARSPRAQVVEARATHAEQLPSLLTHCP